MKVLVIKVFLNDIIGVEDSGTSGIIKQKKIATASNNYEPELYLKFGLLKANVFEGGA
ncbi:MAG: hypothetical protein UDP13_02355 [Butyricicoccus sp.]|nr:hypothetical protein [Butyricicoccus sp.]